MAAQEETRAERLDLADQRPACQVDHAYPVLLEVRRAEHGSALHGPGNAGAQMRQAGHVDTGNHPSDIQVDHHGALAVARRANEVPIRLVEEEVVDRVLEVDAAQSE